MPDDFGSIQDAIAFAKEGQRIFVKPGTYNECIIVDKSLTIIGENAIIIGTGKTHTVQIKANNVHFSGFTVKGKIRSSFSGIYVFYSSGNVIQNNTVTDHFYGIHLYDSSNNTLRRNNLTGNIYNLEVWGLVLDHFIHQIDSSNYVEGKRVCYWVNREGGQVPSDAGYIALVNSSNVLVKNSVLTNNGEGILLAYTTNSLIFNVTSIGNARGIRLISSCNNEIFGCNLSDNNWTGIVVEASSENTVRKCNISKNFKGISLSESNILNKASERNIVSQNNVSGNTYGLWLHFSSENEISQNYFNNSYINIILSSSNKNIFNKNTITMGSIGISLSYSKDNIIHHNDFINNTIQASIEGLLSQNIWDKGDPSGGNFWSDYAGVDADNDGIGDTPYVIDSNNQDRYPQMKPYVPKFPNIGIAIVIPSQTEVYVGQIVNILAVIHNDGDTAGNFTIACKYISEGVEHLIETRAITSPPPKRNMIVTFLWATTNIAICKIKVEIPPLDGEIDSEDNVRISLLYVRVKILGDVNGDWKVDIKDVAIAAASFGSFPGHSRWDPRADIVCDDRVDMKDLVLIVKNFGYSEDRRKKW
ncbi:MAG: NosD domain-containing protein [Candidatus Jordarchaeaceae archaeon]